MAVRLALIVAAAWLGACTAPAPAAPVEPAPVAKAPAARTPFSEPPGPEIPDEPCPHVEGADAKLFEFGDFGPAAMSHALLGQAWWQWDSEGHAFEEAGGTVWIVVHGEILPDALATRFPVRETEQCDHRYVPVAEARAYLTDHIDELEGMEADVPEFGEVRKRLQTTLSALDDHFTTK